MITLSQNVPTNQGDPSATTHGTAEIIGLPRPGRVTEAQRTLSARNGLSFFAPRAADMASLVQSDSAAGQGQERAREPPASRAETQPRVYTWTFPGGAGPLREPAAPLSATAEPPGHICDLVGGRARKEPSIEGRPMQPC